MEKKTFDGIEVDVKNAAERLSKMVQIKTISNAKKTEAGYQPFLELTDFIKTNYPKLNQVANLEMIAGYSMLYHIKGTDEKKLPVLLMAHLDVVPIDADTINEWEYPPFSGAIEKGCVWGRGAIDCKSSLCATLESVEQLLSDGFTPKRDIYLAFGHDEEIMGKEGAKSIAEHCKQKELSFAFVIDEGGGFIDGDKYGAPGQEFCSVGIFEKGSMDLRMTVSSPGGHSSRPDATTALSVLAEAIVAVQSAQFPKTLTSIIRDRYQAMLPYMEEGELKNLVANMESDPDAFIEYLSQTPEGNAMVRTTIAATQAWGSNAPNILPQKAQANINFRLNPTETEQSVIDHVKAAINNPDIELSVFNAPHQSAISDIHTEYYEKIQQTVNEIVGDMPLVPNAMLGGTDSRFFDRISNCIYRFSPFYGTQELGHTIHANNERLPLDALATGIAAYIRLIELTCS